MGKRDGGRLKKREKDDARSRDEQQFGGEGKKNVW